MDKMHKLDKKGVAKVLANASKEFDNPDLPHVKDEASAATSCNAANQCVTKRSKPPQQPINPPSLSDKSEIKQESATSCTLSTPEDEYLFSVEEDESAYEAAASALIQQSKGELQKKAQSMLQSASLFETDETTLPFKNLTLSDVKNLLTWIKYHTGREFSVKDGPLQTFSISLKHTSQDPAIHCHTETKLEFTKKITSTSAPPPNLSPVKSIPTIPTNRLNQYCDQLKAGVILPKRGSGLPGLKITDRRLGFSRQDALSVLTQRTKR